jgi:hypothetical protein
MAQPGGAGNRLSSVVRTSSPPRAAAKRVPQQSRARFQYRYLLNTTIGLILVARHAGIIVAMSATRDSAIVTIVSTTRLVGATYRCAGT